MPDPAVIVVSTGSANLASVFAGLERCGAVPRLCETPDDILSAAHVVLPGVGAFGAAMARLREAGFVEPLRERYAAGRPTLAVCLGLQLLGETSEESPGISGLGIIAGGVERFPDTVRVPQFGWNMVTAAAECRLLASGYAYFANSYRLAVPPEGWHAAIAVHGDPFVAAFERGGQLACQFHPELSGPWGQALLTRWLAAPDGGAAC